MKEEKFLLIDDFQKCADFHGHVCPGLAIGYQAAKAGIAWLSENRARDEEIVAIVETDACGSDAVQVLTGCTFGKGNFIYKDHGKQAFTFMSRKSGKGVRIAMKPGVIGLDERHQKLLGKVMDGSATEEELEEFWVIHRRKSLEILEKSPEALFTIKAVDIPLPPKAIIESSIPCGVCREPTMASKLSDQDGQRVCKDCLA
jgi:formylmethanofuran dehydrogenase subunit E